MVISHKKRIFNTVLISIFMLIVIILLTLFTIGTIENISYMITRITITGNVTNNGPVYEGMDITFTGTCFGKNLQLLICQGDVICNNNTEGKDLLCRGDFTNENKVNCTYKTKETDIGINFDSIATCCDENGNCDTTTIQIEDWVVEERKKALTIMQENITILNEKLQKYSEKINLKKLEIIENKSNLEIEFNTSDDRIGKLIINGLDDILTLNNIQTNEIVSKKYKFNTEAIAVNPIQFENAEIILPKNGNVNVILRCDDWDFNNFKCNNNNWIITDIPFVDDGFNIIFNVSEFSGYAGADITIINVHSNPSLYGNWIVMFDTIGAADLTITATIDANYSDEYTRWSNYSENESLYDLKFLEIMCGSQVLDYEWQGSNCFENECSVLIKNYSCNETAYEISKVLTPEEHVLLFRFGEDSEYAYNQAVNVSGTAAADVAMSPINESAFVIAWVDTSELDVSFKIYTTNGTTLVNTVDVDTTALLNGSRVDVAMINKTHFVVAWIDGQEDGAKWAIYDTTGTLRDGPVTVDSAVKGATNYTDISVAEMGDRFVLCNVDVAASDLNASIYMNNQNKNITLGVSATITPERSFRNLVDCSAINQTRFVIFYYVAGTTDDASYRVYDYNGTSRLAETDIDANVGNFGGVSAAGFNQSRFVLAFYDSTDQDITIAINQSNLSGIKVATDIDTNVARENLTRVAVAPVRNITNDGTDYFVVVYSNLTRNITASVVDYNGNVKYQFTIDQQLSRYYPLLDVIGKDPITGNGLCNGTFIISYTNATGVLLFKSYWINGSEWSGICGAAAPLSYRAYFYNITFWDNVTTVSYGLGRQFNGSFTVGDLDSNELFNVSMFWYEGDSTPDTIIISNNTAGSNMSNYTSAQINGSMRYTSQNLTNLNYRIGYNYSLGIYVCDADGCNQSNSTVLFINNSLPSIMNITLYDNITTINYNLSRQFNCSTYILDGDQNEKLNISFEWYEGVGTQTTTRLLSSANNSNFNLTNANNGTLYFSPLNLTITHYRFGYNYTCRVRVYDAALTQQVWRNSTTLFINDTSPPDLYLYWPLNNTLNLTSNYINFTFNVSDNSNSGVKNCTLWINNIVNRSELSPLDDITKIQNITTYLRNNDYMWKISCTDKNNNINTSESRNISINTNAAPTQAWNLSIQIGTATIVNETTATNKYLLSTHDFTPIINWTNGTDSDGNQIDMFVCIKGVPTDANCEFYGAWTNQSNLTDFAGLNHSGRFYVNITTNDGTINGTTYSTNFTINNTLPVISGSALNGNDTHDSTPLINWSVVDPDAGGNYQWPADTIIDYIVIGNVTGEGVYYNKTDGTANNNSETVTSTLPWNYTRDDWTANRTYTVTVWAGDGSERNGSSYAATLRLYDNLPNITRIWMADDGSLEDCNLAAGSQCSLQAVSHNNVSNLIVEVNATDLDRDCDVSSALGTLYLCNRTSGICNENNYDFNFSLATITKTASDTRNCSYKFVSAQGPAFTPQFYIPGSTAYLLQVNISSQTGQAPGSIKEGNNNATWWYKNVTAVNYTGNIIMGDGTVNVNTWNPGTNIYNITNWGNVILNITWNITNMSGPNAKGWEMNGTDLEIDDDAVRDADTGNLAARGLNATNYTFVFGTGLELCLDYACNSPSKNESMATHWYIYPPSGLAAGTYYGNLTYRIFPV